MRIGSLWLLGLLAPPARPALAADLQVLTTGAYLQVASAMAPAFEARAHDHVVLTNDTAGAILARIRAGAAFDLVVLTPAAIAELATAGTVLPDSRTDLARVGVGVVVRAGAPHPDISTVQSFRQTLLNARSVAYIDPASGGSSGIYVAKLLRQLGIADQVDSHALLVHGGRVADHVANGEAELGIHQISEILPVIGAELVGSLPDSIQSETIYTAAVSRTARQPQAAEAFLQILSGPAAKAVLAQKGMQPAKPSAKP